MAFLRNDAVNRVNLHSSIQAIAEAGAMVFFVVYLLRVGVPIPVALVSLAAIFAGRFAVRPLILPAARRWGLKPLLIFGAVILGAQFPILAEVHGVGPPLVLLCIVSAIGDIFYWPTYHAYFAAIGDAEHRGHQVSARQAAVSIVSIGAPLAGAWAIVTLGPTWMFAGFGLIEAMSALPLIGAPNVSVAAEAQGALRSARTGMALFAADGWIAACLGITWQIALFLSLGQNLSHYGGAMALAGLVGAVFGLVLGRNIDAGHGGRASVIAYSAAAVLVLMRAASFGVPWLAVIANAGGAVVGSLMVPAIGTATYNLSQGSPCPMRFSIATEAGFDMGFIGGCLSAAALTALNVPLQAVLLLTLPALLAMTLVLRRYYGGLDQDRGGVPVTRPQTTSGPSR